MRNLAQYPITADECQETLETYIKAELDSERIGGIQAAATTFVVEFLEDKKAEFEAFLKQKQTFR